MRRWSFADPARRVVSVLSRRAAVGALAGAVVATTAAPNGVGARKKKKLCKKDNQTCHRQGGQSACVSELFACCGQTARRCKGVPKFLACCDSKGWECSPA